MLQSSRWAILALILLLAGCATSALEPHTDYSRAFDFTRIQKVAVLPYQRLNPTQIVLTDEQARLVSQSLARELVRKGFQVVQERAAADAWLSWHLVAEEDPDLSEYNRVSLYECWRCGPAVGEIDLPSYVSGSLIVDIIDPVSTQSVWRTVATTRLRPHTPDQLDETRRAEAAQTVLADFPPH